MRRVVDWRLDGDQPRDLRLTWRIDENARTALENELFGKHVLITDHDDWPVAERGPPATAPNPTPNSPSANSKTATSVSF